MKSRRDWTESWRDSLTERRENGLLRSRKLLQGGQGAVVTVDGRECLNFCSNDYLGLASHPDVVWALKHGAERYGVGAGASHLVNGHMQPHQQLEQELAAFVGAQSALLFSTGYMANIGVVTALVGRGGAVFEDRLNHASLIDAGLLSRAKFVRYAHSNMAALDKSLGASNAEHKLIVTDGVFSMDGDLARVPELIALARKHGALLLVDDAHGLGVLGEHGAGSLEHFGVQDDDPVILMGTLGKAFGVFGAFVAGPTALTDLLIQQARTYIYTTALPPALAEALRASLNIIRHEPERRRQLSALVAQFRQGAKHIGLELLPSATPIQPLRVGAAQRATQMSEALLEKDVLVTAIRPPTVPAGTSRLRITLSAAHSTDQVEALLRALAEVCQ